MSDERRHRHAECVLWIAANTDLSWLQGYKEGDPPPDVIRMASALCDVPEAVMVRGVRDQIETNARSAIIRARLEKP